ncbi:MAG: S-layer homology domain-containing protein [Oscillospiraceae bacterium]|nr:S-layer homology domain-containing protein [Oscillospiraceae bacterium]
MFKRIVSYALALVLVLGLVPAADAFGRDPMAPESVDRCCTTLRSDLNDPDYHRPDFAGKLIDITPQRVADTFVYLEEHYVKNHPEQALDFYTGTAEDRANLKKLAETITSGCKTNKAKADAIGKWISGNITYDVMTSAYASDTFYRRKGNCLSYANLMMFLLRSLGIPAVVGDGWRGDMKEMGAELFNMEGHAWVFVRLDGQWVLYDPLWLDGGTTDRDYMAEWIYFDTVEFVTPVTDGDALPPKTSEIPLPFWTNGKYYLYSNSFPTGSGTLSYFVNNQTYVFVSNQCEPEGSQDGRLYLDGRDKTDMVMGELYRDGWVSYGEYHNDKSMAHTYAFPNGMMADGYTMEFDGKLWYMSYDSAMPILMDESDYWIQDGLVTVEPGFSGPCLGLRWQDGCLESSIGEVFLTYENNTPEVATIDDHGNVTAHAEGYAEFRILLQRRERNGNITLMGSALTQIFVSTEDRTPDYRDLSNHTHDLVFSHSTEATCESWGMNVYKCSGCPYTEETYGDAPLGHDYQYSHTTPPTCDEYGLKHYTCNRCGDSYAAAEIDMLGHDFVRSTFAEATCTEMGYGYYECSRCDAEYLEADRPALGHAWNGTECERCDATRMTPFNDVAEGSFYETPVAWAVERGITNGISATDFGSNNTCNRAQVVTFLWRAAGCPEPASMENPFTDVQKGSFYEKPVLWAVENGITNGVSATTFGPNDPCNRAAVVTFLWRAAGKPEPVSTTHSFTDVAKGSFYEKPVLWAVENGITNGVSATQFGPNSSCNRAQVVTFLYRAFA